MCPISFFMWMLAITRRDNKQADLKHLRDNTVTVPSHINDSSEKNADLKSSDYEFNMSTK